MCKKIYFNVTEHGSRRNNRLSRLKDSTFEHNDKSKRHKIYIQTYALNYSAYILQ